MGVRDEVQVLAGVLGALVWFVRRLKCPRCQTRFTSAHPCRCGLSETYW